MAIFPGPSPLDINRKSAAAPFTTRLKYFLQLWAFKLLAHAYVLSLRYIRGPEGDNKATYTKSYPSSPGVEAQVFIPKSYKAGDAALPLLIDIHGGGFAVGHPIFDAADNSRLANTHGFVVVSIGYRFAPRFRFPAAVHDVADQIKDILEDSDLPIDLNRVATIGYSAGGNLALTAVQLHGLHNRIQAAVAYYPAVDFVVTDKERLKMSTPHPDGRPDLLARSAYFFNWGYVPAGTQLREPLLSPRFADRSKLPKSLYILGAEYDQLCHGAWTMAEELAEKSELPKTEDTRGGDEGWESGTTRWKLVKGVEHGFNVVIPQKSGDEKALYRRKTEQCQDDVVDWLHRVAFAGNKL